MASSTIAGVFMMLLCPDNHLFLHFYQIDKVTRRKVEKKKFETNILKDPYMKHPLQNRCVQTDDV